MEKNDSGLSQRQQNHHLFGEVSTRCDTMLIGQRVPRADSIETDSPGQSAIHVVDTKMSMQDDRLRVLLDTARKTKQKGEYYVAERPELRKSMDSHSDIGPRL